MIEIYRVGMYEYPDLGLDKPVNYTEDILKTVAASTEKINLELEHDGEVIGSLSNFIFKDGGLYADAPKGLDIKGFGISPVFDMKYIEGEDCYIPDSCKLISAALVENPRSGIFYNSIKPVNNDTGDDDMVDDKILESLNKANSDLAKARNENDELKKQVAELSKQTEGLDEMKKALEENKSKIEELTKFNDELKPQAEKYGKFEAMRKEELIKSLTKDEETQKILAEEPLDKLLLYSEKNLFNSNPKGVGESNAHGLDETGTHTHGEEERTDEKVQKEFEEWKKAENTW